MELFGTQTSPYTRIVRIVAAEFGFDLPLRDLVWRQTPDELFRINPAGRIPLLADGGRYIGESRTICTYLMEHPDARPTHGFRQPSGEDRWTEENLIGLAYAAMDSLMIVRGLSDPPAVSHPYVDRCRDRIDHCFRAIDDAAAKQYLVAADSFGMAETVLISAADVVEARSLADLGTRANVNAIRSRFADRPSIRRTAPVF